MACCADCAKMNLNDENKWGEFWCGERGRYYPGSDSTCSYFVERGGGGCYLTTIVVHCLGYDDYCQYLQKLRSFRDEVMKKEQKYEGLLQEYNQVGPFLVRRIEADEKKREVAELFSVVISNRFAACWTKGGMTRLWNCTKQWSLNWKKSM